MAATTNRKAARQRLRQVLEAQLDRLMPLDESIPLKGRRFSDFEEQADELKRALLPTFLEERAALDQQAQVARPGPCPHCGSERVYLEKATRQVEVTSRDGPVVLAKQDCRCRACNGSFSPSGS
jgi:DNA-directed RNA polymerase subunit RPC12/RpoP